MTVFVLERRPVPVDARRGAAACEARGFCGPFANQPYYDAFPEPLWHGMGDCVCCGTTRKVACERDRRRAARAA